MTLKFDPSREGLSKVLKDYQELAMRFVWGSDSGATSKEVWLGVNKGLEGRTVSRASVINFLNAMVDEGVLGYEEESGKGGYHRVYKLGLDEAGFRKHIARTVILSLMRDFPEETREVVEPIKSNL